MVHELRRHDLEITDPAEIDRILSSAHHATIALTDGDAPYLVTLSFGYDAERGRLCFHAATGGRKLELIAANPRACATVVRELGYNSGECEHPYESVVLFGTMRIVEELGDAQAAMRTLIGQLESPADAVAIWERNNLGAPEGMARCRMLVFDIEDLTAKSGQ